MGISGLRGQIRRRSSLQRQAKPSRDPNLAAILRSDAAIPFAIRERFDGCQPTAPAGLRDEDAPPW